jgi:hypothetical protein
VRLRVFGLFCKMLLRVNLTPPARYQDPHDANNPQVGHWSNCKPKWRPQGSTFSSSKTKQRTHKAKRGDINGLVVYADVRIGLTLYSISCSTRYKLSLYFGGIKKMSVGKKQKVSERKKNVSQRHHIRGHQRKPARKGRPRSQLQVPTCGMR